MSAVCVDIFVSSEEDDVEEVDVDDVTDIIPIESLCLLASVLLSIPFV